MSKGISDNKPPGIAKTVLYQIDLYGQLVRLEWNEEKDRLTGILVSLLLGFTFFICLLFSVSGMVLLVSWDSQYRNWIMIALLFFYILGIGIAWYSYANLARRSNRAFSDTRAELAEDTALLRKKFDS